MRIRRKPSDYHDRGKGKTMIEISERDFDKEVLDYQDKLALRDLLDSLLTGLPAGNVDEA